MCIPETAFPYTPCVAHRLQNGLHNETTPNTTTLMADLIRIILSVIIPPLGVFFKVGFGKHFWINILLTMLGYIPGLVHAIWILASYRD